MSTKFFKFLSYNAGSVEILPQNYQYFFLFHRKYFEVFLVISAKHDKTTNDMKRIFKMITVSLLILTGAESLHAQESRFHLRGYSGNAELGIIAKEYPYGSISTTHGFNFGNGWFIGGGAAFQSGLYPRIYSYPVPAEPAEGYAIVSGRPDKEQFEGGFLLRGYFDARYACRNARFTPFVDLKAGVTYDLALEAPGGFILPSVGVAYGRFSLSAGLDMHLGQTQSGCLIRPDMKFMPFFGFAVHF